MVSMQTELATTLLDKQSVEESRTERFKHAVNVIIEVSIRLRTPNISEDVFQMAVSLAYYSTIPMLHGYCSSLLDAWHHTEEELKYMLRCIIVARRAKETLFVDVEKCESIDEEVDAL